MAGLKRSGTGTMSGSSGGDDPIQGAGPEPALGAAALSAIEGMVRTFALNDVDGFVGHLTDDVVLEPPPFLLGKRHFEGHDGIRAGFDELDRVIGRDRRLRVWPKRYCLDRGDPDRLLVLVAITVIQPDSQEFGAEATLLLTMRDEKVCEYRARSSFEDGLARLDDPVEVQP